MRNKLAVTLAVIALLAIGILGYFQYTYSQSRMPDWISVQEGPVAHGVEKFYRSLYVKGNLTTAGDVTVVGETAFTEASGTITTSLTLTPTATFYNVSPAPTSQITVTLSPCTKTGQTLILYNSLTQTVNIANSDLVPSGAITLGQYDIFVGLCDGADWLKLHQQNN